VRIGVLWAVVLLLCLTVSSLRPYALAFVMAAVAAIAAGEVVDGRLEDQGGPDRWVAQAGASVLPLLAVIGLSSVGGGLLVVVVIAAVVAFLGGDRSRPPFARAGAVVTAAAVCGGVGASVVVLAHLEIGAIVIFLASILVWDASDYIVGSGAKRPWEGPVAGAVALVPVTIVFSVLRVPPFRGGNLWAFVFLAVLACPAGQLVASALLPTAASRAPALRRLDSLIVAAPAWAILVWVYLQRS
jgi:hypothetical protein